MASPLKQTEAQFQAAVLDAARLLGWRTFHARPAQSSKGWRTPVAGDGKGFPDLVLVHPVGGVLYRELKSETGRLTSDQAEWLRALEVAGEDADVWRPADWDRIRDELATSRKRPPKPH